MDRRTNLSDLLREWRQACAGDAAPFYFDGIIGDESTWFGSKTRVLFLGKEPNNRDGLGEACGHDLRELYRNPEKYPQNRKRFELNIGRWAHALAHTTPLRRSSFAESDDGARDALLQAAVVNLKKTGGSGQCAEKQLIEHAGRHRQHLLKQLELLSPTVVVCCGKKTFQLVRPLLSDLREAGECCYRRKQVLWIDHCHPSARKPNEGMHNRLIDLYRAALSRE